MDPPGGGVPISQFPFLCPHLVLRSMLDGLLIFSSAGITGQLVSHFIGRSGIIHR